MQETIPVPTAADGSTLDEKQQQQRQRILETCHALFFKLGVRSVTMDDIAGELGMSKKTIYQFFANKDAIVGAVVEEHLHQEKEQIRGIMRAADNPIVGILEASNVTAQMFKSMNPALIAEMKKYYPEAWAHVHEFECRFWVETNLELIESGRKQGLFRENFNAELVSLMHVEGFDHIVFSDTPDMAPYAFVERYIAYELHFLYGMVTEKGRQFLEDYLEDYSAHR